MQYRNLMYSIANRILHDEHLAEDAVHNAFMRLINHVNKLSNMNCHKVKPFLIIVVRNASFEIYNKRKASPVIDVQYDIPDDSRIEDDIHMHFEVEALVARIEAMPKLYGEVLLLKYFHELENKEIAHLLSISETNVRKRIERARALLFDVVGKEVSYHA